MASSLAPEEWELVTPQGSAVFGSEASRRPLMEAVEHGTREPEEANFPRPRRDGRAFGEEFFTGGSLTFVVGFSAADQTAMHTMRRSMSKLWRGDSVRQKAQEVVYLRHRVGPTIYRTYGRPRPWTPSPGKFDKEGFSTAQMRFDRVDYVWYGDDDNTGSVVLNPPTVGGFTVPFVLPLTMSKVTSATAIALTNVGDMDSYLQMRLHGPIGKAFIELVDVWRADLDISLGDNAHVDIDNRPWKQTVLRDDGANLSGKLHGSLLANMVVPPGTWELVFGGDDPTGQSFLNFSFLDAYSEV